jgi:hypothetical protein
MEKQRIVPLRELPDRRVATGDPDVRGWEVVAADGVKIGRVRDLLVDTREDRVRYLELELDPQAVPAGADPERAWKRNVAENEGAPRPAGGHPLTDDDPTAGATQDTGFLAAGAERHAGEHPAAQPRKREARKSYGEGPRELRVLAPVGAARLKEDSDQVFLEGVGSHEAVHLPPAGGELPDRQRELELRRRLAREHPAATGVGAAGVSEGLGTERDFYAHELYEEELFYGPRRRARNAREEAPAGPRAR